MSLLLSATTITSPAPTTTTTTTTTAAAAAARTSSGRGSSVSVSVSSSIQRRGRSKRALVGPENRPRGVRGAGEGAPHGREGAREQIVAQLPRRALDGRFAHLRQKRGRGGSSCSGSGSSCG